MDFWSPIFTDRYLAQQDIRKTRGMGSTKRENIDDCRNSLRTSRGLVYTDLSSNCRSLDAYLKLQTFLKPFLLSFFFPLIQFCKERAKVFFQRVFSTDLGLFTVLLFFLEIGVHFNNHPLLHSLLDLICRLLKLYFCL